MNIDRMIDDLVAIEGGYVHDSLDSGGETIFGVTIAVARAFGYTGSMRDMPRGVALQIYRERYWTQPKFDQVALHSVPVAEELFDTGVNCGTGRAATFLQRSLNVLNKNGNAFPDITADGAIGRMTLAALRALLDERGTDGELVLLRMLNGLQSNFYIELAEARPKDERFMFGWQLHRVGNLS